MTGNHFGLQGQPGNAEAALFAYEQNLFPRSASVAAEADRALSCSSKCKTNRRLNADFHLGYLSGYRCGKRVYLLCFRRLRIPGGNQFNLLLTSITSSWTLPFHGDHTGSNPVSDAILNVGVTRCYDLSYPHTRMGA